MTRTNALALRWRTLTPLIILAVALASFVLLRATRAVTPPVEVTEKAWLVNAVEIVPSRHAPNLLLYGTVEAPRRAAQSAAVTADVAQVPVAEGETVSAGQPLVILDDRDISLTLRQRAADLAEIEALIASERARHKSDLAALGRERTLLELARKAVERADDLRRRQMGSQAGVDEARQALERQALSLNTRQLAVDDHEARLAQLEARRSRAQALRDQARLDHERTRLSAPFAGRVARLRVAPGDRVRPGDPLIEIYANAELEIRAQLPFRYVPQVREALGSGRQLEAVARIDGQTVHGSLDRLGGETGKASGGMEALFRITDGEAALVPGRLVPLLLDLPAQQGTVELPFEALYGLTRVYRLQAGRMEAVEVERVGERRGQSGAVRVLVRSPVLEPGDRIITTQLPNAMAGLKVTVVQ